MPEQTVTEKLEIILENILVIEFALTIFRLLIKR